MTAFEQQVADALIAYATKGGQVQIGVMEDHIKWLTPQVAAAIRAAADKPWARLPGYQVVGAPPGMDYPARDAALEALRGDSPPAAPPPP